jgi:tRNA A-37 threonylcarbamoyl transferase component Bud32
MATGAKSIAAAVLGVLLSVPSARADQVSTVTVEAFPPETEIRAFLPGSPPRGDAVANGSPFQVRNALSFPLRMSAPGYKFKEAEPALLRKNASAPGEWSFHYELEPYGLLAQIKHPFRRYPARSFSLLTVALLLAGVVLRWLRRRSTGQARAAREALRVAEREAALVRERLLEVDPEIVGRVIDDYEVLSLVGEGAFARVYKVRHTRYGDLFAMKILRAELLDQRVGERVEREMSIGRDLIHPCLVRAFGFGTFREAPYLILEFVEGTPLDERLAERPMGLRETLRVVKKVAQGLMFAHGKGVVHRDLKPANLFLTPGEGVKILDFGVAKILDSQQRLTLTGQALGTPHYMSPEQARGMANVGSDIYALAAITFEMLTGSPPYDGDTAMEVLTAHTFGDIPSARALNPEIPVALDALLSRMLAKSESDRPGSMAEVLRHLEEVVV